MLSAGFVGTPDQLLKDFFGFVEGTRNDVNADEFAHAAGRQRTRFGGGFHGADISADEDGDVAVQEIFFADENDIGGFHHGVGGFDRSDETACFDHPKCFVHRRVTYQKAYTKAIDSDKIVSI